MSGSRNRPPDDGPRPLDLPIGDDEVATLMRGLDWSRTPLGPLESWPRSLRGALGILLPSKAPMALFWGPQLVTLYNAAYAATLGRKHPAALGRPARENSGEPNNIIEPALRGVLDSGQAFFARDYPFLVERRGFPEEAYFDVSYAPVRGEDGGIAGVFCVVSETTDGVLGKRRLRTLRELGITTAPTATAEEAAGKALESLAAARLLADEKQRTAQLEEQVAVALARHAEAEAQLRQAQKMEAVGRLTGGLAHDFNNLLQVIGGNLQLLARDLQGNARAERRVETALNAVERGAKLAAQLLAFGRRQPLEPRALNLGRLVRGLDEMLRRAIGEEIEIETRIAEDLWHTLVDPMQVENALLNLAINARDAMEGRGRLTIEAGNAELDAADAEGLKDLAAGQYVVLAVSDTGSGIPPDLLERVFEPFFTTKPEGQGTGLGLSMVYGFAKQSGGHARIRSAPGQGTTVQIYLPRTAHPEDQEQALDGPAEESQSGGNETVLVVEDEPSVRATVVETLADLGYRVLEAADAQSALALLGGGQPVDLLFTDMVMPGPLRSPELARQARERMPGLAVLFTSGYTEDAIVQGGRLDAGTHLLRKPYSREALARKLRHALRSRQQIRMQSTDAPPSPPPAAPGLRILLVEDEILIRMTSVEVLIGLGHQVLEAGDADEALALLDGEPVDLLLTDEGLPGVSGTELAIRARARRPTLPLIFATGRATIDGLSSNPALSGAVLLAKPYGELQLADAVKRATGQGRSGQS